jgi:hypothetical protein
MCPTMDANNTLSDNADPELVAKAPRGILSVNAGGGRTRRVSSPVGDGNQSSHTTSNRYNRTWSGCNPSLLFFLLSAIAGSSSPSFTVYHSSLDTSETFVPDIT